jgi:uncharacterized protein involved in type VI secretion and phage assembly
MTMLPTTLAAALADYRLDMRNRPLRMVLGQPGTADTNALLPHHASASESVCGGIELQILCLSENATLELKRFIGLPCELQIVTDRGHLRSRRDDRARRAVGDGRDAHHARFPRQE